MHTVKITPNSLFEHQCTNLPDCRIESKKNYSVARIESTLFARIGMLCCTANQQSGEITARQTRKHGVTKLCSVAYLTTEIELVLPTLKSWTVHKIMEYLTL